MTAIAAEAPLPSARKRESRFGGQLLRRALIAGSQRVIANRDELNRINVFPVPDGDTGTNMAFTFSAVLGGLRDLRGAGVDAVLRKAADDAIDGARGNSGAIVAQFFSGLALSFKGRTRIGLAELVGGFQSAAQSARLALAQPREGTILSVISACSIGLRQRLAAGMADLAGLFKAGLAAAREALAHTPQQLRVLAQAGVVDAGGKGFVDFLEGVDAFIREGRAALGEQLPLATEGAQLHAEATVATACDSAYRYCTECLLSGSALDPEALRQRLTQLPLDSLVLAGGGERMRVHAHTDDPAQLFVAAEAFGHVSARKADDMRAQARSRAEHGQVAIVCDSAADLPPAEIERLNIHIVPVRVNFGREEFLDRITMNHEALYQRLRHDTTAVRTSQPPSGDFRRLFDMLASQGREVVCLNISGALSGTWQAAHVAAQRSERPAQAIDTRHAACGEGLLVLLAAEAALAGRDAAAIRALVEAEIPHTLTFALIRDLRFGVQGGRMPRWLLGASRLLRFFVAIRRTAAGVVKPWKMFFGQRKLVERFEAAVLRQLPRDTRWRVLIGHCDCADEARAMRERLSSHPAFSRIDLVTAGTAIGAHAGPGSLVIGLLRDQAFAGLAR